MHPSLTVPPGLALPLPSGIFEILLLVTFAAHLLVMNVALGGTLLLFLAPGADRGAAVALGKRLPTTVAITVNLGIPPLLFATVLYGRYLYTAAVLSAAVWLSLFLVVMIAYALLYRAQPRLAEKGATAIVVLAACLLLVASFILVNVSTLSVRPEAWKAYFDHPGGTIINFGDPTFFPRWLHFVTASLAVAGLFLALVSRKAAAAGDAGAAARMRSGLWWFTRATMVQFALGLWFLFALPGGVLRRFMGGSGLDTLALLLAVVLAVFALLAGLKAKIGRTVGFVVATVCAMTVVRELARRAYLAPDFSPASLPVLAQWGPFVMFAASFVVCAGIVVWMVSAYRRQAGRG
jgi:hypothetical protein